MAGDGQWNRECLATGKHSRDCSTLHYGIHLVGILTARIVALGHLDSDWKGTKNIVYYRVRC
jgi:hypothetical protein